MTMAFVETVASMEATCKLFLSILVTSEYWGIIIIMITLASVSAVFVRDGPEFTMVELIVSGDDNGQEKSQ